MSDTKEHRELLRLIAGQDWHLNKAFSQLAKELAPVLRMYRNLGGHSVWKGNEAVRLEIRKVLKAHNIRLSAQIERQILGGYELANNHADKLVKGYTAGMTVPKPLMSAMLAHNQAAINPYLRYGKGAKTLSKRVWNITRQTEGHITRFIKEGLLEGRSAADLSKDLRGYLKEPDRRFRRIRDKNGKLIYSNPARNYKPKRGVYRSSYKNALRLARNEINIAYRMGDNERRKQMPFVVGITVCLSNAHPKVDICDDLVGDYPVNFVFTGWHPNCLCYTISKLLPKSEFKKYLKSGKIPSKYKVKGIDLKRRKFVDKHKEKLKGAYFFEDNKKIWEKEKESFGLLGNDEYLEHLNSQKISKQEERVLYSRFNGYVRTANSFTINSFHRGLLKRVTSSMEASVGKTTKILDGVIAKNQLKQDIQVFRMLDRDYAFRVLNIDISDIEKLKNNLTDVSKKIVGKDISDKGFMSTSCIEGANVFQNRKIMLKMKAKKGTKCFIPRNTEESEVVFGRDQTNIITDMKIEGNKVIIFTEMFK